MLGRYLGTLAAAMALTITPALGQAPACVPKEQAKALVVYALPEALAALRTRCEAHLAETSPLMTRDIEVEDAWANAADMAWPDAKLAVKALMGPDSGFLFAALDDEALQQIAHLIIAEAIGDKVSPDSCGDIGYIYGEIKPLPVENFANLAVFVIRKSQADKADGDEAGDSDDNGFAICND